MRNTSHVKRCAKLTVRFGARVSVVFFCRDQRAKVVPTFVEIFSFVRYSREKICLRSLCFFLQDLEFVFENIVRHEICHDLSDQDGFCVSVLVPHAIPL